MPVHSASIAVASVEPAEAVAAVGDLAVEKLPQGEGSGDVQYGR